MLLSLLNYNIHTVNANENGDTEEANTINTVEDTEEFDNQEIEDPTIETEENREEENNVPSEDEKEQSDNNAEAEKEFREENEESQKQQDNTEKTFPVEADDE